MAVPPPGAWPALSSLPRCHTTVCLGDLGCRAGGQEGSRSSTWSQIRHVFSQAVAVLDIRTLFLENKQLLEADVCYGF